MLTQIPTQSLGTIGSNRNLSTSKERNLKSNSKTHADELKLKRINMSLIGLRSAIYVLDCCSQR